MDIETIKAQVRNGQVVISAHADQEAADEEIDIAEIYAAILNDEILELYEDTGRGPSCLILGFVNSRPIHANKIMNQKMDPTTPQKSMSYSFVEVDSPARTARTRGRR